MRFFYNIGIRLYYLVAWIMSAWNEKARLWIGGRKDWMGDVKGIFGRDDHVVWFHCASLGEFEQGRPLMEAYRERCPEHKILLTFFSPSGYEKRKDFEGVDHVMYLPLDTARNARRFLDMVPVKAAVFIKYEFWFHFLWSLQKRGIPVFLASGIFRPQQIFFRWYGAWYRRFLTCFTHIFVQQEDSLKLLKSHGIHGVSVAGDTRFDRVVKLAETPYSHPALESFCTKRKVIVAGSTWDPDEELLEEAGRELPEELVWIIAPHELGQTHLGRLRKRFEGALLFTGLPEEIPEDTRVIIVDTIGQLSYLYRFATLAYIGGGFGKGIHNILEAATYGIPVIFGPRYEKFAEAVELLSLKGAFSVSESRELLLTIRQQVDADQLLKTTSEISRNFVIQRAGASGIILDILCKK